MIESGNNPPLDDDDFIVVFNEIHGSSHKPSLAEFEFKGESNEVEAYLTKGIIELDRISSFEEQEFKNELDQSYFEENCIGLDQSYQFASNQADNTYLTENSVVLDQTEFIENEQLSDHVGTTANVCRSLNDFTDSNQVSAQERESRKMNIEYDISKYISNRYIIRCTNKRVFLYDHQYGTYNELSESDMSVFIRSNVSDSMDRKLNKNKMLEIAYRIESDPQLQINFEDFNRHNSLINFRNCVYDTDSRETLEHKAEYLFTHYVDADYNPNHQGLMVIPPNGGVGRTRGVFNQFLQDSTQGDLQKIKSLQELTGYIISNYCNAKKFFILIGQAHTGKSLWLGLWRELVGAKHTTAITLKQLGTNRFMTAELSNSRLNISPEMNEEGSLKGIDVIKALTGGDLISAEKKGKDPFFFYGKTKLVSAGNHMPELDKPDSMSALTDRMMFLLFNQSIPEEKRDKELMNKLLLETESIVTWAIEGLHRLKEQNFVFTESDDALRFKAQYISDMSITDFINDECLLNLNNPEYKVHRKDIYSAYLRHARDNQSRILKNKDFFAELTKLGVESTKLRINGSTPLQGFRGIKLK